MRNHRVEPCGVRTGRDLSPQHLIPHQTTTPTNRPPQTSKSMRHAARNPAVSVYRRWTARWGASTEHLQAVDARCKRVNADLIRTPEISKRHAPDPGTADFRAVNLFVRKTGGKRIPFIHTPNRPPPAQRLQLLAYRRATPRNGPQQRWVCRYPHAAVDFWAF
jgi:hypothetical protein